MVGTYGQVEIAASLVEHQRHPERNKAGGHPGIIVRLVRQPDIHEALRVQLPQAIAGVVGCSSQTDVAASVTVPESSPVVEPRLRHDNGRQRIGHHAGRQFVPCSHVVVPSPIRHHLAVRQSAHRLRDPVPVIGIHGVPCAGVHEDASIAFKHPVEALMPERFGYRVPFGKVHVTPKREVGADVVCRRAPENLLAFKTEDDGDGSAVEENARQIRLRHDWRCRFETMPEPLQADRSECDQGEHDCERPSVWKSHSCGTEG